MVKSKTTKSKHVFHDASGSRWRLVKTLTFLALGVLGAIIFVSLFSLFNEKGDYLLKKGGDTNFDVVSDLDKAKITAGGAGTFVNINYNAVSDSYEINRYGETKQKTVVLTFDDGPHPVYTKQILNVLDQEKVPATFFLLGENVFNHPEVAKEIVDRGYEIGNHTFSHKEEEFADYDNQKNRQRLDYEINFTQDLIKEATGYKTRLFRTPFWGAEKDIEVNTLGLVTFALDKGYIVSSPTLDSFDWKDHDPKKIFENATVAADGPVVLLFHDAGGNRNATVQALPEIIKYYKSKGYTFAKLYNLTSEPLMEKTNWYESLVSKTLVGSYYFTKNFLLFLNPIFIVGLAFSVAYSILVVVLSLIQVITARKTIDKLDKKYKPKVTVIVPAYNEQKVIAKTIKSILNSSYRNFKVLVIDDGSTDKTFEEASKFKKYGVLRVVKKENGGKASALNLGIHLTKTDIFVAIDADTQILKHTLGSIVKYFQDRRVGAVAGNVKVGNPASLFGVFQSVEYTLSLNIERNAYSILNSILVVPGAIGAWRTEAVRKVGKYSGTTLAEDSELTLRLLSDGYKIVYDKDAVALTEAPQKIKQLFRQRFRWTFGVFQTLFKHRNLMFKKGKSFLGTVVLPFTVFVQIPIMLLTPLMDVLAIYYLFFVSSDTVAFYALIYLVVRMTLGLLGFIISGDDPWPLLSVPFSRIFYHPLLYLATYKAVLTVLKGSRVGWNKGERTNSVSFSPAYYSQIKSRP